MNFLAHAALSPPDPEVLAGNLAGDFVKGRQALEILPPRFADGVRLHRRIDLYTDDHPATRRTVDRLRPRWGRYSPILADVFYDHVLARDWAEFHAEPLDDFTARAEHIVRQQADAALAASAAHERALRAVLAIFERSDRMRQWATHEGIERSLLRISRRALSRDPGLERAVVDLAELDEGISADFRSLWVDLRGEFPGQ